MPFEPIRDVPDRGDDRVGTDRPGLDRIRAELAGADEDRPHAEPLRAGDVGLDVVADHPRKLRIGVQRVERRLEVGRTRLAYHDGLGVPEYHMTAAVWLRGFLKDDFSVDPRDVAWFTGGVAGIWLMKEDGTTPHLLSQGVDDRGADHPRWLPASS